jgi:hypothetical protein
MSLRCRSTWNRITSSARGAAKVCCTFLSIGGLAVSAWGQLPGGWEGQMTLNQSGSAFGQPTLGAGSNGLSGGTGDSGVFVRAQDGMSIGGSSAPTRGLSDAALAVPGRSMTSAMPSQSLMNQTPAQLGDFIDQPLGFTPASQGWQPGEMACPPTTIPPVILVRYDALFLTRGGNRNFTLSRGNPFDNNFKEEFGGRYSVSRIVDGLYGWEVVAAAPYDWTRTGLAVSPGGNLQTNLTPFSFEALGQLTAFQNAFVHTQLWRSHLQSFELNRRSWAEDVLSTFWGFRVIEYEEDYEFNSFSAAGDGQLLQHADNLLVGMQIGGDLYAPRSQRLDLGVKGRLGAFLNFNDSRTILRNVDQFAVRYEDQDVDVSVLVELGAMARYRITPRLSITGGYEAWYIGCLATVPKQRFNPGLTNQKVVADGEIFLHGGFFGLEFSF